jgi:hypothetical protein
MPFFKVTDTSGIVGPDLTGINSISTPDYIQFDVTTSASPTVGRLEWDTTDDSLTLGLTGSGDYVRLGEDQVSYCINKDTVQINKGQVVYLSGAQGDKVAIKLAINTSDTTSSKTFGIAMQNIAANQEGYVMNTGRISGLNLGAYATGDILWLGNTAGSLTVTKPVAPEHMVFVGVVLRANAGNGILYVKPQNGYELGELHNVLTNGATDGQVLTYVGASSLWTHKVPTFSDIEQAKFHQGTATVDVPDRNICSQTNALTGGVIYLHQFTAQRNMTVSSITMCTGGTASSGLTLARMGLYTTNDTTATLVARTASDTTLFNSTLTTFTRSFATAGGYPATYDLVAGTRYALAVIVTGTTPPSLVGGPAASSALTPLSPRILAARTAQTDLTATVTSFSNTNIQHWGRLS